MVVAAIYNLDDDLHHVTHAHLYLVAMAVCVEQKREAFRPLETDLRAERPLHP